MATPDEIVKIVVEIIDNTKAELEKIERRFDDLERRVSRINSVINVDAQTRAANHAINHAARPRVAPILAQVYTAGGGRERRPQYSGFDLPGNAPDLMRMFGGVEPMPEDVTRLGRAVRSAADGWGTYRRRLRRSVRTGRVFAQVSRSMGTVVDSLIPSYRTLVTVFAALVPILLVLIAGAAGVAVSLGAVAAAGAGVVALGLAGEGRSMAEAFERAQQRIEAVREAIFEVFQPVARAFAPLSQSFLADLPGELVPLRDAIRNIDVFYDAFRDGFRGVVEFGAEVTHLLISMEVLIERVADVFGRAIGDGIIGLIQFVTVEAARNTQVLMDLAMTLVALLRTVYVVAAALSKIVSLFRGPAEYLAAFAEMIGSRGVAGLIAFVGALLVLSKAASALIGILAALNVQLGLTNALTGGVLVLAGAIAAGALAYSMVPQVPSGAASFSSQSGSTGNTYNYNYTIQGDVSEKVRREMEQTFYTESGEQSRRTTYMSG